MKSVNTLNLAIGLITTSVVDMSCRPMVIIPSVDVPKDSDSAF